MSVVERAVEVPAARAKKHRRRRPPFRDVWWRHVVAIIAAAVALFPVLAILSAAFNGDNSLVTSTFIPRTLTFANFRNLFYTPKGIGHATFAGADYPAWFANSLIVCGATAVCSVLLSALAAYAFSRFRFKGRRVGMLTLILVQTFPQFLAAVAIYLIVFNVGAIFHFIALNTLSALIIVYLGGALGINTWLMKGFFDTIPMELDESARVDGATPAQVFWAVVLPLAAPVLAVIGLISFITALNEFLIASIILQTSNHFTLTVGLFQYVDQQYSEHWGPFAAGVVIAAIVPALLFVFLQRYIVQGLTRGAVKG